MQWNKTMWCDGRVQLVSRHCQRWLLHGHIIFTVALALLVMVLAEPLGDAQARSMPRDRTTQLQDQPGDYTAIALSSTRLPAPHAEIQPSSLHGSPDGTPGAPLHSLLEHQHLGALLLLVCLAAALLMHRAGCRCRRRAPSGFLSPPLAPPKPCMA